MLLRGLLALQSTGDVESAVKLMQEAVDLDEKCEFAYETLGTIGKAFSAVYRKLPSTIISTIWKFYRIFFRSSTWQLEKGDRVVRQSYSFGQHWTGNGSFVRVERRIHGSDYSFRQVWYNPPCYGCLICHRQFTVIRCLRNIVCISSREPTNTSDKHVTLSLLINILWSLFGLFHC